MTTSEALPILTEYPEYYFPKGGYMPFPPQDCECIHKAILSKDRILWLDNYFCESLFCKRFKQCGRRREYKSKNYAELKAESQRLDALNVSMGRLKEVN